MAMTVEEYKNMLSEGGFRDFILNEGWENPIDNMIDYEGINFPLESDKNTVYYKAAWAKAESLWEAEEEKAVKALGLYLREELLDIANGRIQINFEPSPDMSGLGSYKVKGYCNFQVLTSDFDFAMASPSQDGKCKRLEGHDGNHDVREVMRGL